MTSFQPKVPNVVPNRGDERDFILQDDYKVDCGRFAKSQIDELKSIFREESRASAVGRISPYRTAAGRKPTSKKCYHKIIVPKGFIFDGTSIPDWTEPLRQLIDFPYRRDSEELFMASVVHDWLYHTHQFTREATDDLFFYMLRHCGVSRNHS